MDEAVQALLAGFSDTVRSSTLKRVRQVPDGAETWAISPGAMSFADLAQHIVNCDRALLKIFETKSIGKNLGEAGLASVHNRIAFDALVVELRELKSLRKQFILDLSPEDLNVLIDAERIRGVERMPAGLLILEILDHEIHHRGQMATYLRVYEAIQAAET